MSALPAGPDSTRPSICLDILDLNTPLAHRLYSFAEAHRSEAGGVWAGSFHQLCRDWSGRAGLPWKEPADSRTAEAAEFWNDESGLLLLDAAKKITDRFDALVIDEAQDFMPDWFEILISLLRDPSRGRVYVFRDENQDLWNRNGKPPWPMPRFPLRTNRRNTRAIGEYFSAFVGLDCRYLWSAPPGVEREIISYNTEAERARALLSAAVLDHFPEAGIAHYVIASDMIRFLAVGHQSRRPRYWTDRI